MSHRQQYYKPRGGKGGVFPRLGVPVRSDNRGRGGNVYRGRGDRGRRGNYRQPGTYVHQRQVDISRPQKSWFKIIIIRGSEYPRDFIFKALESYLDHPLWPVLFKTVEDGSATFFVDDKEVADSIGAASRRVQAPNGQKMTIRVQPTSPPYVPLDTQSEEAVKAALLHRYNAISNHLDLSKFSFDPAFQVQRGLNLSLQRNNVMMTVVDIIAREQSAAESIRSIDLSHNRMRFMDFFASLVPRLPNVTRLILHHNQIESLAELEKLSGWNLTELDLDETPLCAKYRDNTTYIGDIRRIFKKVTRIDGVELPPETKFGIPDQEAASTSLPPFKSSFFVDENVKGLTLKFLELYFTIFDDENRQKRQSLLEAYDDDATFTLSAMNLTAESNAMRGDTWQEIMRDSHNILKMELWERFRAKLVHRGKLAVLSFLCSNFPATSHMADSFVIDISFASGNVLCVNASGIFRERGGPTARELPLRYFNRVFLLVQNEKGLCIVNDMLTVSTLTDDQHATYMKQLERAAPVTGPSGVPPIAEAAAGPSVAVLPDSAKLAVLEQFCKESGMKAEWARKCLEDYDFDYAKGAAAFAQLKQAGAIPPEAFQ